jgi:hypothetical protein
MNHGILLAAALLLTGCATPYQREGATGGFSETQYADNVFQVTFKGNGFTAQEIAADYTLLRSAEVALEHGFAYFVVVDAQRYSEYATYTTPRHTYASATAYGNTAYGSATTYGGHTYLIAKPHSSNVIACFKEKPEVFSFEARFLIQSLKQKYGLQ